MINGFIIYITNILMKAMYYMNLVELFKYIAGKLTKRKDETNIKKNKNIAIDIFISLKWLFLWIVWRYRINNTFVLIVTIYLTITNIYTYLYYHVWNERALLSANDTFDKSKRRFISLLQAIMFSDIAYAYLYDVYYHNCYSWPENIYKYVSAIQLSLSNSIGGSCDVLPLNNIGSILLSTQLIISFLLIAVILSSSIPQSKP